MVCINYITVYLKAAKEFENKAKTALDSKDNELIAALVHALKPKWKMMGMAQSMELGNKIELLCLEQGNESKITECIFMLVEQNDLSMKALEA